MATFYVDSNATGAPEDGTTWDKAFPSLSAAIASLTAGGGDTIYVANNHVANYSANTTLNFPGALQTIVECVTSGTTTAATGGKENTNGNYFLYINGNVYIRGLTLEAGSTGSQSSASIVCKQASTTDGYQEYDQCIFTLNNSSGNVIRFSGDNPSTQNEIFIRNSEFRFGATSQVITVRNSFVDFSNCTVYTSGSAPASLFLPNASGYFHVNMHGCDFSKATTIVDIDVDDTPFLITANNCRFASVVPQGTHPGLGAGVLEYHACSNDDDNWDYYHQDGAGVVSTVSSVYLTTGGAASTDTDGSTAVTYSLEYVPTAACTKYSPLRGPWIYQWLGTTGSKTFTMQCAHKEAAVLKDNEAWLEVEYMGGAAAANVPQSQVEGSFPVVTSTIVHDTTVAGSNLTDTGVDGWTGLTDEKEHALAKTVTVDEVGYFRCRVVLAKDVGTDNFYVDPKVTVS